MFLKCEILAASLIASLSLGAAQAASPHTVPPRDEPIPTEIKVIPPLPPISAAAYESSQDFMVAIFGGKAKKIFSFYSEVKTYDFAYPNPRRRLDVVYFPDQLKCYRRIMRGYEDQFRCNLLFHPAQGTSLTVGAYTFKLEPTFDEQGLDHLVLQLQKEGETRSRILIDEECPHVGYAAIVQGSLSCAYFSEENDISAVHFPDDIDPQGVAVGWGVQGGTMQPDTKELR
ncbi:hypothetical protein [Oligoflexus tunisiensis]|uniref:hypothetical protein n=1 Tax=Oligoflexus tunisiensis TaxID=708132 RepID=UPI00114D0237|nr:hypothetical protein [Oligoflexus tunisiensis]